MNDDSRPYDDILLVRVCGLRLSTGGIIDITAVLVAVMETIYYRRAVAAPTITEPEISYHCP